MSDLDRLIETIDDLVDHSLAQPIVDDYNTNRYAICELCGNDWHGIPVYVSGGASCPGMWASDEDQQAWRTMFPPRYAVTDRSGSCTTAWQLTPTAQRNILAGEWALDCQSWRIALFTLGSNISQTENYHATTREHTNENGYETGGRPVELRSIASRNGATTSFIANPVWTAKGRRGITARYAALYEEGTGITLCHCLLSAIGDMHCHRGNTLTIDSSTSPMLTMHLTNDDARIGQFPVLG